MKRIVGVVIRLPITYKSCFVFLFFLLLILFDIIGRGIYEPFGGNFKRRRGAKSLTDGGTVTSIKIPFVARVSSFSSEATTARMNCSNS